MYGTEDSVKPISSSGWLASSGVSGVFRSTGNTAAAALPTYEPTSNGSLANDTESYGGVSGTNPTITYTDGHTYPIGDARNYLPELTNLGVADTSANFAQFSDTGNGTPYFANPPALPSVVGATSGGVTADQINATMLNGTTANEYAEAADPNPTGLISAVNNANGLNQPLGSQVDYQAVDPVTDGSSTTTTSSGPNLMLIAILLVAVGVGYWAWKTHKLKL